MKRVYEYDLEEWYQTNDRKPLILRGARQVGKSTLVRLFAQNLGLDLIEINLEKKQFQSLKAEQFDIQDWVIEIESIAKKKVHQKTLIFIDEIQAQVKALAMLRYFYEERPEIAVISAGSLLEIALHNEEVSFPVGRVSFMWIGPMTFGEYLMAQGSNDLYQRILENNLLDFHHQMLLDELKKYYFIGGMPKSIKTYIETKSFIEVRAIQEEILQTYQEDFPKYGKRINTDRLSSVFKQLAFHLGKKLIYQHLDRESKSIEVKKCIELFIKANIIVPVYHSDANGIPLRSQVDTNVFKIYFLDIGLVNCLHEFSWDGFNKIFDETFSTKGFLAEQFVAQHLAYHLNRKALPELMYWLRDKNINKAEIDFLTSARGEIFPIEVKSQSGGKLKSLKVFAEEKNCLKSFKLSKNWFDKETLKISEGRSLEVDSWPLYSIEGLIHQKLKH
ncbi:MAG: AAA family ATPase [Bacteriovorax sp.]|nr:AAA family ATPase [Bacteriovorax sp.]